MRLNDFLNSKGYDTTDIELMDPYIKIWKSWYVNKVPSFQNYYVYNGEKKIKQQRYCLGMAKKVAEDYANLLLNEKVTFKVGNETENKVFNELLDKNDFYNLANSGIERTFATGTGAFILSLGDISYDEKNDKYSFDKANLKIEFVSADKIKPLSYNRHKITECGFGVEKVIKGKKLLYFTIHKKNEKGNYVIENYLFKVDRGNNIIDISNQIEDTFVTFDTESENPWFSIVRPNVENNLYEDNPFGISVVGNSIDILKGIDIAYDSLVNEFVLGKKRIIVSAEAIKPNPAEGTINLTFDPNDLVFHTIPGVDGDKPMVQEIDMNLRIDEHEKGIQLKLNLLSSKVFGANYYKFDRSKLATATEVMSDNSELFRTIHKHEITIENCLYDLFKSICYIAKHFLNLSLSEEMDISIDFDDSIFEDKKEIKNTAIIELNNGLISPIEYYMKVYKMTKKQAIKYYEDVQKNLKDNKEKEPPEEE